MIKKLFLFCLLGIILVSLLGCNFGDVNGPSSNYVTIRLGAYPSDQATYYMEIYVKKSSQTLKKYSFENIGADMGQQLNVSNDATSIEVYLLSNRDSYEPMYFWSFKYSTSKDTYSTYYWLDYSAWCYNNEYRFGISDSLAAMVTNNGTLNVNFDLAPYFLYKIYDTSNQPWNVKVSLTTGAATLEHGNSLGSMTMDNSYITSASAPTINVTPNMATDTVYVLLRAVDYSQYSPTTMGTVTFGRNYSGPTPTPFPTPSPLPTPTPTPSQIAINGIISDMVPGSTPGRVFAINQTNAILYYINPVNKLIDSQFTLPDSQPLAMAYSAIDNKIYIVSKFSGSVTVWNVAAQTYQQFQFSTTADGVKIAVAPSLRRIYALTTSGLYILNMDTGAVLLSGGAVTGTLLALDENRKQIFTAQTGYSPSSMYRYSVANDQVSQTQYVWNPGSNGQMLRISPDGNRVLFPCGGGNGAGYTVYAFDATNLTNVLGEWNIGTYPHYVAFNSGGSILYGVNGDPYDNNLYVMNAANYTQIRKLSLPNADACTAMAANSDGTVLVAFTYDNYYNNNYYLYFLGNIQQTSSSLTSMGVNQITDKQEPNYNKTDLQIPKGIEYPKQK